MAKIHEKIANIRKDNLHKISKEIINENQVIVVESLSIKNMIKNHKLAKNISSCSWGELFRQLEYKSKFYGRTFYKIDKWYSSSKTCNNCNFKLKKLQLNIRNWKCPSCGIEHDRDHNAAKNILKEGIKDLSKQSGSRNESDLKQKFVE